MNHNYATLGTICAVFAFVLCLAGGVWILSEVGFDHDEDALSTAIGLYFLGKAFFVGPMLLIAARQPKER